MFTEVDFLLSILLTRWATLVRYDVLRFIELNIVYLQPMNSTLEGE